MPTAVSYPGVYIEEVPSGVRTITGVATSNTAFLGRAALGPVNKAYTLTSFADFEGTFGGLQADYPASYAVRDFFLNGGSEAIFVRVYSKPGASDGKSSAVVAGTTFKAATEGKWGDNLRLKFDADNITDELARRYGTTKDTMFNLTVSRAPTNQPVEKYVNLSVDPKSNRKADAVLEKGNSLLRISVLGANPSAAAATPLQGGDDGKTLTKDDFKGNQAGKSGLYALEDVDLFNLLCIPADQRGGDTDRDVYSTAMAYCATRRAMLIVDAPAGWHKFDSGTMNSDLKNNPRGKLGDDLGLAGLDSRNSAIFYPRLIQFDPNMDGQEQVFPACGVVAGLFAKTDATRGVWKAPAGQDAGLTGVRRLAVNLTDGENGLLNPVGINCLRFFKSSGNVIWGSRTLRGDDQLGDEYKYVPVRRLALFIEESLYRGTQWAVFEPNDEPLWAQLRLNIGVFMHDLFRQGAFQGRSTKEAFFVKCDKETTTQSDINRGVVNVAVGFAPLKPAEFVVIKIQQMAGQLEA